jgi:putative FmdB family regulatory protein
MPIYEFECPHCKTKEEVITTFIHDKYDKICCNCGKDSKKIMSLPRRVKMFQAQILDIIDDDEKPIIARTTQEAKDAIKKYNDGKWADKSGKVAILE